MHSVLSKQLKRTLSAEDSGNRIEGKRISGPAGGDTADLSQIGVTASEHGHRLMALGCTVEQVVHDYGDLCQAIQISPWNAMHRFPSTSSAP